MMQELEMGARRRRSPEPAPDATADESAPRRSASASAVDDNDVSNQFSLLKKWTITVVVSFLAFSSTFSSTTLFPAIPEIATDYNTTGEIITFANTGYLIVSSISPLVWNPLEKILGRRVAYLSSIMVFLLASIGTALSPNLPCFIVMRALSSLENSYLLMAGTGCIGDMFIHDKRGFAVGIFLTGTVVGPAIGPVIGAAIVTYTSWRVIFWAQAGMVGLGFVLAFFLFPSLHPRIPIRNKQHLQELCNPVGTLRLLKKPNTFCVFTACGTMSFCFYSVLTPIRYVVNPRFNLTSPVASGLFYLAPGLGCVVGSLLGGRYSDYVVQKSKAKRNGRFVPEDRLRAGLLSTGTLLPLGMLLYGWPVEYKVGGIAVPVIGLFLSGAGQMTGFTALNTYCRDISPGSNAEVLGGKYFVQYIWSALGSGTALLIFNNLGIGRAMTLCSGVVLLGTGLTWVTYRWGAVWREAQD